MNNWGVAIAYLDLDTFKLRVKELIVIHPDKSLSKSKKHRKSTKDIAVVNSLFNQVLDVIEDADIVIAETPIGGRDANSALAYAMCISVISIINDFIENPVIEVSPFAVKDIVNKNASKEDIISWAFAQHREADWKFRKVNQQSVLVKKHAEHCSDAIAALYAGSYTDQFNTTLEKFL